ncbi:MAG: ABC-2 transporter permease [Oscillospiraceae bacterium]
MNKVIAADFSVIRSESKLLMLLPLIYTAIGVINTFFRIFSVIMVISIMVNVMGYNERSGFDRYLITMPVSRKMIVITRYVTAIGLALIISALQFALSRLRIANIAAMAPGELSLLAGTVCLYVAVMFPILIKLGVEKGRTAYLACMMAAAVGAVLVSETGVSLPQVGFFIDSLLLVTGAAAAVVSCLIAIKFYENREF